MNWQTYQDSLNKDHKRANKLIAKLKKNPTSKNRLNWLEQLKAYNHIYDSDDIEYLLKD